MLGDLLVHRLRQQMLALPVYAPPPHPDWDTPEGEEFLRRVLDAMDEGVDVNELGEALGVPNLRYVVAARERFIR